MATLRTRRAYIRNYRIRTTTPTQSTEDLGVTEGLNLTVNYTTTQFMPQFKLNSGSEVDLVWGNGDVTNVTGQGDTVISPSSNYTASGDYEFYMTGSLKEITYLQLQDKPISGDVTNLQTELPNLTYLNLTQNLNLSGSAANFGQMSGLTYLAINSTNISGDVSGWSSASNLETVIVNSSAVSGDITSWKVLSGSMTYINLSGRTTITGDITDFSNMSGLTYLNLTSNNVSGSINGFGNCPNIVRLYFSNTNVVGDVSVLKAMSSSLEQFQGQSTSLTGNAGEWKHLINATLLYAPSSNISGDMSELVALSGSLDTIDLSYTNVSGSLSQYGSMTALKSIYFTDTSVEGDISTWSNKNDWEDIYLSGTNVSGDLSSWGQMTNLDYLFLGNTNVSGDIGSWGVWTNPRYIAVNGTNVSGDIGVWVTSSFWTNIYDIRIYNTNVVGDVSKFSLWSGSLGYLRAYETSCSWDSVVSWSYNNISFNLDDCDWTSTEVDDCLNSFYVGSTVNSSLTLRGNNASRTSNSDEAYAALTGSNTSVLVN